MNSRLRKSALAILWAVLCTSACAQADIWQKPDQVKQKCTQFENEIEKWWSPKDDYHIVPQAKFERAVEILQQIPYPSNDDLLAIRTAFKNDFADSYLKWRDTVGADCPAVRIDLVKALVNSPQYDHDRIWIGNAIISSLYKPKYPTLLNASIDALLREYAATRDYFKVGRQMDQLRKLRSDLKQEAKKWSDAYDVTFTILNSEIKGSSPEALAKLKTHKDLEKIKKGLQAEQFIYDKYTKALNHITLN